MRLREGGLPILCGEGERRSDGKEGDKKKDPGAKGGEPFNSRRGRLRYLARFLQDALTPKERKRKGRTTAVKGKRRDDDDRRPLRDGWPLFTAVRRKKRRSRGKHENRTQKGPLSGNWVDGLEERVELRGKTD